MINTLNQLTKLVTNDSLELTLEEIATIYKQTLDPILLATAFYKTYKLILNVSSKYFGLTSADIASFSLEKLDMSLQLYEPGTTKFTTYFTTVLVNKFREETQALSTDKRKMIYIATSYDELVESGYDKASEEELECTSILEDLCLNDRERQYCTYLIQQFTNKEISDIMGVSQMTLSNIRKKLRVKLLPLALSI